MVKAEHLDIRTVTMGISLLDCADCVTDALCGRVYEKIMARAGRLVPVCETIEKELGIPIVHKRIAVTPIALVAAGIPADGFAAVAATLDRAALETGVNFIGGFSALVHKGFTRGDTHLIDALPAALAGTKRVCASVNVATSKAGINMDAVAKMGRVNRKTTAVRIIPAAGKKAGERVEFGGLLGTAPVMAISRLDSSRFVRRGGQIPPPISSLTN